MFVKLNKKYPAINAVLNKITITAINFSKHEPNSFIKIMKNKAGSIADK